MTLGPPKFSKICTQCVSESARDSELLFNMIVHLGNPGARETVQLLVVTSVSSGIPGAMEPTLSSSQQPNHHEKVDRSSVVVSRFRPTSLVNKLFLIYYFE